MIYVWICICMYMHRYLLCYLPSTNTPANAHNLCFYIVWNPWESVGRPPKKFLAVWHQSFQKWLSRFQFGTVGCAVFLRLLDIHEADSTRKCWSSMSAVWIRCRRPEASRFCCALPAVLLSLSFRVLFMADYLLMSNAPENALITLGCMYGGLCFNKIQ